MQHAALLLGSRLAAIEPLFTSSSSGKCRVLRSSSSSSEVSVSSSSVSPSECIDGTFLSFSKIILFVSGSICIDFLRLKNTYKNETSRSRKSVVFERQSHVQHLKPYVKLLTMLVYKILMSIQIE